MTEHTHEHETRTHQVAPDLPQRAGESMVIPSSILVGAILICATMFYSTDKISKKITDLPAQSAQTGTIAQLQNGQQAQRPAVPTGPVQITSRASEPVLGNKNAKVTIVEFADFQCPFCKQFYQQTFGQIKSQYIDTGKVDYIFRHFPLPFHTNANISGIAAECANRQGKFWEYHDVLFTQGQPDGTGLDEPSLKKYARQLNLDTTAFAQCMQDPEIASIVQSDMAEGTKAGTSGTPTFYINGVQLVGAQPFASFKQVIDSALAK